MTASVKHEANDREGVGATLFTTRAALGEVATRISGLSAFNSCASGLSCSTSPAASRYSISTSRPST